MLPGCCRSSRPAAGRLPPGRRQQPPQEPPSGQAASAWRPGSSRLAAGQHPPRPNGCWPVPERMLRPGSHCLCVFICCRLRVARCSIDAAAFRPRTRRWALALRPEHHPRSDQSGHVEQPACGTRCPKEPHAQRSWHLQRSPPAQSEDLPPEEWLAESLRRRAAPPRRAIARAPRRAARRRRDSANHTSGGRSSDCAGGDR